MNEPTRREVLRVTAATVISTVAAPVLDGRAQGARPNILWLVSEDNNPFLGCYGDTLAHTPNIDASGEARPAVPPHVQRGARLRAVAVRDPDGRAPGELRPGEPDEGRRVAAVLAQDLSRVPARGRLLLHQQREDGLELQRGRREDLRREQREGALQEPAGRQAVLRDLQPRRRRTSRRSWGPGSAAGTAARLRPVRAAAAEGRVKPSDVRVPAYLPDTPEVRADRADYYNIIERMDGEIGARLKELEEAGLADDTIVFYYSDNGGVLPRSKRYCYDDGLRCAMVVAFPPKWQHLAPARMGTVVETPVSLRRPRANAALARRHPGPALHAGHRVRRPAGQVARALRVRHAQPHGRALRLRARGHRRAVPLHQELHPAPHVPARCLPVASQGVPELGARVARRASQRDPGVASSRGRGRSKSCTTSRPTGTRCTTSPRCPPTPSG